MANIKLKESQKKFIPYLKEITSEFLRQFHTKIKEIN